MRPSLKKSLAGAVAAGEKNSVEGGTVSVRKVAGVAVGAPVVLAARQPTAVITSPARSPVGATAKEGLHQIWRMQNCVPIGHFWGNALGCLAGGGGITRGLTGLTEETIWLIHTAFTKTYMTTLKLTFPWLSFPELEGIHIGVCGQHRGGRGQIQSYFSMNLNKYKPTCFPF